MRAVEELGREVARRVCDQQSRGLLDWRLVLFASNGDVLAAAGCVRGEAFADDLLDAGSLRGWWTWCCYGDSGKVSLVVGDALLMEWPQ